MADPVRFSRFFHSREIPGWHLYTREEAQVAAQVARSFLTPVRRRWGEVVIVEGLFSRDSLTRRTGAHGDPGSFDWVPVEALNDGHTLRDVGDWVATHMADQYGELIVEPIPFGGEVTGHLHSTRPGVGSPGSGEYLIEVDWGRYEFGRTRAGLLGGVVVLGSAALAIWTLL